LEDNTPNESKKKERMKGLFNQLEEKWIGRSILAWAESNNVNITWDTQADTSYFSTKENTVYLMWNQENDRLIESLAHELRHAWQHSIIPLDKYKSNPYAHTVFLQFIEADAFSFQMLIDAAYYKDKESELFTKDLSSDISAQDQWTNARRYMFDTFFTSDITRLKGGLLFKDYYAHRAEQYIDLIYDRYSAIVPFAKHENDHVEGSLRSVFSKCSQAIKLFPLKRSTQAELINEYEEWRQNFCHLQEQDLHALGESFGFDCEGFNQHNIFDHSNEQNRNPILESCYTNNFPNSTRVAIEKASQLFKIEDPYKIISPSSPLPAVKKPSI